MIQLPAIATAELDPEIPDNKNSVEIKKTQNVPKVAPSFAPVIIKKENSQSNEAPPKEIFSFTVPPAVSGNVIPHLPVTPAYLPPDSLYLKSNPDKNFKYPISWRLKAKSLFDKPTKKDFAIVLNTNSASAFNNTIKRAQYNGWVLKDSSQNARHLYFRIPKVEKEMYLAVAIKDNLKNHNCELRARILPYSTQESRGILNSLLQNIQSTLNQKEIL